MKYNQKKKKENIEIFLFIMVMAVFAAVLGVMSLGEKMQPVNQIRKISSGWYYYDNGKRTEVTLPDTIQAEKGEELILGPFQGPIACTRIRKGRGVCGTAWAKAETLVVPDVDAFPGHIACSSLSRSEIVVPLIRENGEVWGVLDIDSESLNTFDEIDARFLGEICSWLWRLC